MDICGYLGLSAMIWWVLCRWQRRGFVTGPFLKGIAEMDATTAFARYEELRPRLPKARFPKACHQIGSLLDIADQADVFVFDAYGVLNVGEAAIAGAAARIAALRGLGKQVFVLSNSASNTRAAIEARFAGFGFSFAPDEIISSRDAALEHVTGCASVRRWGVIAPAHHRPQDLPFDSITLGDDEAAYRDCDGVLFLAAALWTTERQKILEQAIRDRPRPVAIANPDLVAPRETGLSLDPGYYGHALADATGHMPTFLGKPFATMFERVEAKLSKAQDRSRIVMVGDTLHTDILGGAAKGWRTALVTDHGVFAGLDVAPFIAASGILPDWQLGTI